MKLLAIGSGSGFSSNRDTYYLDKVAVGLTGKQSPTVLHLPFASNYNMKTIEELRDHYLKSFGIYVKTYDGEDIGGFDLVYISGGNVYRLFESMRENELESNIVSSGKVIVGFSAGALWMSSYGTSGRKGFHKDRKFTEVKGSGIMSYNICVHYEEGVEQSLIDSGRDYVRLKDFEAIKEELSYK